MKYVKKISSIVLALIMVLTMGTSVFAAVKSDDNTKMNEDKGIVSDDGTISIAKQMVFINAEATTVREPNITYTYTISAVTPTSAKITDENNITGTVKKGVIDAVAGSLTATTSTITFADTSVSQASATGSTDAKYANFTFTAGNFPAPGIYRYMITESTNVDKATVGITADSTYNAIRYLDVYVQWTDDNHSSKKVYGYVLYEGDADQSIVSKSVDMKSAGYVNTADDESAPANVDVYKTQNLHIAKTTTGALADPGNDFPIALTFTAATGVTAAPKIDVVLGGNGTLTGTDTDTVGPHIAFAASMAGTVRNGSTIDLTGIPEGTKVSLVETNNTPDSYKVKAGTTDGGVDLLAEAIVASRAPSGNTTAQTLNAKVNVFITNTLDAISPTNVVMRFAPYLFILGGAMMLLVASRRRKSDQE